MPSIPNPQALSCLSSVPRQSSIHSHCFLTKRATPSLLHPSLSFLKSLYPAIAALRLCQLSHHICADKELISHAPASVGGPRHCPQLQTCRAAPLQLGPCSGLQLLLTQGKFLPWALRTTSCSSLPLLLSTAAQSAQTLALFCTIFCIGWLHIVLDGRTGSPQQQLSGCLTLPGWDSAGTKAQSPFLTRSSSIFILSTTDITKQAKISQPASVYK